MTKGYQVEPTLEEALKAESRGSHKCKFVEVPWDRKRLGPDVILLGKFYATYKYLYSCHRCGVKKVIEQTALI